MAPPNRRRGPSKAGDQRGPRPPRRGKPKFCVFCAQHTEWVDYKDVNTLRRFLSDRGKIRSRRVTGNCAQHQRALAQAIKTARELVLLPYTQRTVTERPGGRRGDRGDRVLGDQAPPTPSVSVEVIDDTDAEGDPETEAAVVEETAELVEELVEQPEAEAGAGA